MFWWRLSLFGILLLASCDSSPTRPSDATETVVLFGSEAGEILVLQPQVPDPVGGADRIAMPRHRDAFALSPDRSTVYFTAFNKLPDRTLHAFDTRTRTVTRSRPIADILGIDDTQAIVDTGGEAIVVSPDGSTLFIAGWRSDRGDLGVGLVNAETFEPTGFIGPLSVRGDGLAALPPAPDRPNGAVLALGRRPRPSDPSGLSLFVIDPETGAVVDSLAGVTKDTAAYQLVAAADGRHVYLNGAGSLVRYDLEARTPRERVELPTHGSLSLAPDGQELYRTVNGADANASWNGKVFVFSPTLADRNVVDLSDHTQGGFPPMTLSAETSYEHPHLYVVTGTASFGHGGPYQPGRLFIVNLADRGVERVIELNSWNVGPPFVSP